MLMAVAFKDTATRFVGGEGTEIVKMRDKCINTIKNCEKMVRGKSDAAFRRG